MKTAVVYYSQTGFTKRYAQWIAEAVNGDCLAWSEAKNKDFSPYEAIVFGSWLSAGRIGKNKWFRRHIGQWTGKKLIVFATGASPINSPQIESTLKNNFLPAELAKINLFYCPGGFNYDKMSIKSRLMIKMFIKILQNKKDKTAMEQETLSMISSSYDISNKNYTQPIVACLKA